MIERTLMGFGVQTGKKRAIMKAESCFQSSLLGEAVMPVLELGIVGA